MKFNHKKSTKLSDITTIIGDGLHGTPKYSKEGSYYFINGRNLNESIIIDDKTKKVNDKEYEKYKKDLNDRTIFLSINGTIGNTAYYNDEKVVLGKSVCYLNIINEVNKDYVYYLLKSREFKDYYHRYSTGTTIKNLGLKEIRNFEFILPSKEIQSLVASIILSYDKKIETNNKIIANLEAQAQAIFKYYFIDFEPFTDGKFIGSDLGSIPEGWDVKKVSDICKLKIGRTPPRKESECFSTKSGVKWVSIKDMGDSNVFINETSEYLTDAAVEKYRVPLIVKNTLIMSFKLTVGRIAITTDTMTSNEAIAHFNNPTVSVNYLYYYFKNFNFNLLGNTSSIGNAVNSKIIKNISVLVPKKDFINIFDLKVEPIMKMIKSLTIQNQILA